MIDHGGLSLRGDCWKDAEEKLLSGEKTFEGEGVQLGVCVQELETSAANKVCLLLFSNLKLVSSHKLYCTHL